MASRSSKVVDFGTNRKRPRYISVTEGQTDGQTDERTIYCSNNALMHVVLRSRDNKCMPSLLYGLEAFPLVKSELSSLDFVINRFL